jgi:hypothetical protein
LFVTISSTPSTLADCAPFVGVGVELDEHITPENRARNVELAAAPDDGPRLHREVRRKAERLDSELCPVLAFDVGPDDMPSRLGAAASRQRRGLGTVRALGRLPGEVG